ncbi:helix-turn-helix domain-containing protein [Chromobacterium sp. IIBBL 290-4]|uniref:AraC family transcriptional regulator n=1 Tax=Chromobacterium sp. IIBBL 290-4 TaxID=2953890 RepID=UPI0020B8D55F|nr:helix-turn-helix transcriptional regulator [Chromobacterium sp. IIBBL 290-4]UTH75013.1 helix-turn-helix transcriptional regulator [Chromobacterium sp. IIBBL 290-4]
MRSDPFNPDDDVPRELVLRRAVYPAGAVFDDHVHARGQFAYAARGVMSVFTAAGNWVVPAGRAVWLPAGLPHGMRMSGQVEMWNVFVSAAGARRAGLGGRCQVVAVSPLLEKLLEAAALLPARYPDGGRDGGLMNLLLHELAAMPGLPLNAPLPKHPRLAALCRSLLAEPSLEVGIEQMAERAAMSRRTFTRLFQRECGMGFALWRQQACLLAAIARLDEGLPVSRIAADLGYGSVSAFSAAFRRALGAAPTQFAAKALPRPGGDE